MILSGISFYCDFSFTLLRWDREREQTHDFTTAGNLYLSSHPFPPAPTPMMVTHQGERSRTVKHPN